LDSEMRLRLVVGLLVVVVIGVFLAGLGFQELGTWTLVVLLLIVILAAVAILVYLRNAREAASGFPLEDERTGALKMRAGYLAFWASMYFCLGMGWIYGIFIEGTAMDFLTVAEMMFVIVAVMGVLYMLVWAAVSRGKGTP